MSGPQHYAGDITPTEAWEILARDPAARLVDVRTAAEWSFVGVADLGELGRQPDLVEWQFFPDQRPNADFIRTLTEKLDAASLSYETPLLFLCRSGARSRAAAVAMSRAGFSRAFNIAGGFEGDPDSNGHRGETSGWKAAGLPWRQS